MARRTEKSQETVATLLRECIAAGAYYWFRAEGPDENLVSALNRLKYQQLIGRFSALNIPGPSVEEMYAHAADKWPEHKLHAGGKHNAR